MEGIPQGSMLGPLVFNQNGGGRDGVGTKECQLGLKSM